MPETHASLSFDAPHHLHTWIELDRSAFQHNLGLFRRKLRSRTRICFAVKANAYGHGLKEMVHLAIHSGQVDSFAVHSLPEALELLSLTRSHLILVLGYIPLAGLPMAVKPHLALTVWNQETIRVLSSLAAAAGVTMPVHLKLETGTNRHGVHPKDILEMAHLINSLPGIELKGLSTHYANIEDTTDYSYAEKQSRILFDVRSILRGSGYADLVVHSACSAAALLFPSTHLDMIRIGIAAYGLWPSRETLVSAASLPGFTPLKPVLSWKSRISQVKVLKSGEFVGYGCTFRTTRQTVLGIVPVGYSEGYPRGLSGVSHVLIRGFRAPVRGRICMNIIIVDLTDIPNIPIEETVTLIGREGGETIGADDLAATCGTISYEIVSRLSSAIPRFIT